MRYGALVWAKAFTLARTDTPSWVVAARAIPADAVVLTNDPFSVAWWSNRNAVIIPRGTVSELDQVLARYRPSYYLDTSGTAGTYAFRVKRDLEKVASSGPGESRWAIFRIVRPYDSSQSSEVVTPGLANPSQNAHP